MAEQKIIAVMGATCVGLDNYFGASSGWMRYVSAYQEINSKLEALQAAVDAELLDPAHAEDLRAAWTLASRMRNASVLFRGRPVDSVPSDLRVADGVGRIMGMEPGSGAELADLYRRFARRARAVVELDFYDAS